MPETIRQIYNKDVHDFLKEVVADYEGHDASTELMLGVGEVDLSDDLEDGDWSITEDAVPWTLFANVTGELSSHDFLNAPLRLRVNIAGHIIDAFDGKVALPEAHEDYSSSLLGATPGTYLDKIPLRVPVEYFAKTPAFVIRNALYRIRAYDKSKITIPRFSSPLITKLLREGDGFEDNQYPQDILDSVKDIVGSSYYDEPHNRGHTCYKDVGTGAGQQIAWHYDVADDKQVYAFSAPTPASPAEQYTSVVVRERHDDGSLRLWSEYPVFYGNLRYAPEQGQTLFVDFDTTDESPIRDPGDLKTRADAQRRAKKEADDLGRMVHFGSFDVAFNPFLKPMNVLSLESVREDNRGKYRLIWRSVVTDLSHSFDKSSIHTTIGHRSVITSEVRLADPPIVLAGVNPQVIDFARDMRLLVMETEEDVIIDDSATWVIDMGEDFLFTDDAPVVELEGAEDLEILR